MTDKVAPVSFNNPTLQVVHLAGKQGELSFVVDAASPHDGVKMVASALPQIGKALVDFGSVVKGPFTAGMKPVVLADGFDFFVGKSEQGGPVCVPLVSPKEEADFDTVGSSQTAAIKRALIKQAAPTLSL